MKRLPHLVLSVAVLVTGCNRSSDKLQSSLTAQATKIYTKAELDKLIAPGMTIKDVTNMFGPPASSIEVRANAVTLMFTFPFEITSREERPHLTGFDVHIEDGKVVDWSPIIGESSGTSQMGSVQGSRGQAVFAMFLVTQGLTNALNTFEAEGVADASSLRTSPDLTFKAKVFAGDSGTGHPGEQSLTLILGNEDAAKLKDLTQRNFGKRLLIVCHNKVIAAPVISVPIASNRLLFTVKNSKVLESVLIQKK